MKVTVFTSCYNQGRFLPSAIESVLNQTHRDIEYILIDDGSTDNTKSIIAEYAKKDGRIVPVYLPKQPNIATVLNLSLTLMKSDVWVWVPSDDIAITNLIEEKLKKITPNSIVLAWGIIVGESGSEQGKINFQWNTSDDFRKRIWEECFIGMTGVMIHRNVFNKVGNFPEHMNFSEDFYWILKSTKFNIEYSYIDKYLYKKRIHGNRLTARKYNEVIANIPKIKKEVIGLYGK